MLTLLLLSLLAIFAAALVQSADAQESSDYPLIGCLKIGFPLSPQNFPRNVRIGARPCVEEFLLLRWEYLF